MRQLVQSDKPSPIDHVIRVFGWKRAAQIADLTEGALRKWKGRGGGLVPAAYQPVFLLAARAEALELTAEQLLGVEASDTVAS
jgi:hypothetical protein